MENIILNNGVKMPNFGLETYLVSPKDAEVTVRESLKMGYRLIDTANAYVNERYYTRTDEMLKKFATWKPEYEKV